MSAHSRVKQAFLPTSHRKSFLYSDWAITILVGFALWFAHFGKAFRHDDNQQPFPPMNAAFEFLFAFGQPLAIFCMVIALLIFVRSSGKISAKTFRGGATWMFLLNLYISTKLLYFGNDQFFLQAIGAIFLTVLCFVIVMPNIEMRSFSSRPRLSLIAASIWIFAFLLVTTTMIALLVHPDSAVNENGRLHGTTVNPQALAMHIALITPALIYAVLRVGFVSAIGLASTLMVVFVFVIQYNTGSRMGFAAAFVGAVVALRDYVAGPRIVAGLLVGGFLLLLVYFSFGDQIVQLIFERFVEGREDTRSQNWEWAWRSFLENPLFGVDPQGERLIFVENFWLAAASTGGIVAVILSIPIAVSLFATAQRIRHAMRKGLIERTLGNFFIASMAVLFGISCFEAAFLGILASHTMLAYLYFAGAANVAASPEDIQRRGPTQLNVRGMVR